MMLTFNFAPLEERILLDAAALVTPAPQAQAPDAGAADAAAHAAPPHVFTVTDTTDNANDPGSLRYAVNQANALGQNVASQIVFNLPTGQNSITLSSTLVISAPVSIDGSNNGETVNISAPGTDAMYISSHDSSTSTTIQNLFIQNSNNGIVLDNASHVDLNNVSVLFSTGAGLEISNSSDISLLNNTFVGNDSSSTAGGTVLISGSYDVTMNHGLVLFGAENGLTITGSSDISLNVSVSGTSGYGIYFDGTDAHATSEPAFQLFSDPGSPSNLISHTGKDGVHIQNVHGDVNIDSTLVLQTGGNGVSLTDIKGDITANGLTSLGNAQSGLYVSGANSFSDIATNAISLFGSNAANGAHIDNVGRVAFDNVNFTGNHANGLEISAVDTTSILAGTFNSNAHYGLSMDGANTHPMHHVSLFIGEDISGSVPIQSVFINNGLDGLSANNLPGDVIVDHTIFGGVSSGGNAGAGAKIIAFGGDVIFSNDSFGGNGSTGLLIDGSSDHSGNATFINDKFDGNQGSGLIASNVQGRINIIASEANNNNGWGVELHNDAKTVLFFGGFSASGNAQGNILADHSNYTIYTSYLQGYDGSMQLDNNGDVYFQPVAVSGLNKGIARQFNDIIDDALDQITDYYNSLS